MQVCFVKKNACPAENVSLFTAKFNSSSRNLNSPTGIVCFVLSAVMCSGKVAETKASMLTKAVENGEMSLVALFTVRLPRWSNDIARGRLSALALFLIRFIPGLFSYNG